MTVAPRKFVIAGAGIGGLSAALALSRAGHSINVHERRENPSEAGAGIQLGPNATRVLDQLGLLGDVLEVAARPNGLMIHDGMSGDVLAQFPLGDWLSARHGAPYVTLHRQDLHRILLRAVESRSEISMQYGSHVAGFANTPDGIDVQLSDGGQVATDGLIAADGLWSTLRPFFGPTLPPQPTSKCAYRAVLPQSALPMSVHDNNVHIWLAAGAHVVHYPVGATGSSAVIVVIDSDQTVDGWESSGPNGASTARLEQSALRSLWPSLRDALTATRTWGVWRLHTLAPPPHWVHGAAALLGDAAHPIMPFFAQGASLAIEDASALAQAFATGGHVSACLAGYESARKARARRVLQASLDNGRIYHLSGLPARARNTVLRLVPGSAMMRRYDWLYGWRV